MIQLRESAAPNRSRLPERRFLSGCEQENQAAHARQKDRRNNAIEPTQSDLFGMIGGKDRWGEVVAAFSVRLKCNRIHGSYLAYAGPSAGRLARFQG